MNIQKLKRTLRDRVSLERYLHMISTAETAKIIATLNGYKSPENAYIAGLLHDIVREDDEKGAMDELVKIGISDPRINERTAHAFLGAHIIETELGITDRDVLFAVRNHDSVLTRDASTLYKIVYLSDKMEPLRKWHNPAFIEAGKKDIDQGFKDLLQYNVTYAKEKYGNLNAEMRDAVRYYKLKE
jgi:predicted HD superfamily hydrolase involved in NAD metabolism